MRNVLSKFLSHDSGWLAFFLVALAAFYPELVLTKSAPLVSDHWEQHYPWAYTLYKFLHEGRMPLWTPLIQCGFPIAAESQIGVFYLPNLILSLALPFHAAYAYTLLFHYAIAGWGLYLYGRIMGLIRPAAFLAAVMFVFGTSYGGGYYNITSLKTLAWFPVMLWAWEKWLTEIRLRWLFLLACIGAQSLVAGYMQVAALGFFVFGVYAAARFGQRLQEGPGSAASLSFRLFVPAIFFALLGVVLALPQILLTYQMAILSNRTGAVEDYAYVGSMSPLALLTLLLPNLQGLFRGNCLYSGGLAIFCILAIIRRRNALASKFKVIAGMAVFCLLLALGQWSPLYVGLIKLTHFYSFRTPSKFLIFFNFYLILLAAYGFEKIWLASSDKQGCLWVNRKARVFIWGLGLVLGFVLFVKGVLLWQRDTLTALGEWLLRETLYGRAGHPHSWADYQLKLSGMLDFADEIFSFRYRWTVWTAGVLGVWFLWAIWLQRTKAVRKVLVAGLIVLAVDLYGFSYADVRSDFSKYLDVPRPEKTLDLLMRARAENRLGRIYGFRSGDDVPSLIPSVNMLYGIEDIGSYSPLVPSRYYQTIGAFGNVNDSNEVQSVSSDFVLERLKLLSGLDVTHIISRASLEDAQLRLLSDPADQEKVYQINLPHARFFFPKAYTWYESWGDLRQHLMRAGFDPQEELLLERKEFSSFPPTEPLGEGRILNSEWGNGQIRFEFEAEQGAFFVIMQTDAAGWMFTLNGQPVKILKAYGMFQAFFIPQSGRYELKGRYELFEAMKGRHS